MLRCLCLIVTVSVLAGCGNLDSIFRTQSVGDDGQLVLVGAKQRGYIVTPRGSTVVCAEPSPDALSTFAASLSADAAVADRGSGSLAAAFAGSAASIGIRTPAIQALRDVMYRVCEAYAGGAINGQTYALIQTRYQGILLGLLAIEQLTGVVAAPTVALTGDTGSSGGVTGSDLQSAQAEVNAARERVRQAEADLADKNTGVETARTGVENAEGDEASAALQTLAEAEAAAAAAQARLDDEHRNLEAIEALRDRLRNATATASTVATITPLTQRNPAGQQAVADAVQRIVGHVLSGQNQITDFCLLAFSDQVREFTQEVSLRSADPDGTISRGPTSTAEQCVAVLQARIEAFRRHHGIARIDYPEQEPLPASQLIVLTVPPADQVGQPQGSGTPSNGSAQTECPPGTLELANGSCLALPRLTTGSGLGVLAQ